MFDVAMAKREEEEARVGKRRRGLPVRVVESEDDSEESEDEMGDEFEGVSDEVESEGEQEESEEEEKDGGREMMGRIMQSARWRLMNGSLNSGDSDSESMEGSRSRSEEDLRDIGSARRLDDDDTGDSAWKEAETVAEEDVVDWGRSGNPEPSSNSAQENVNDEEKRGEMASGSGSGGGDAPVARGLDDGETGGEGVDAMEMDEDDEDAGSGEADSQSERGPSVSVEDSEADSGGKGGTDGPTSSAYSRAFSKIIQSKAAKESDTGPVLAARQTLVAKKLEEEAGEVKEKTQTNKEKKELREKAHLYPQSFTDTKEKDLVKLATRGVVKLFNAVSKAQKVQASADGRDAKAVAKQSKSAFLSEVRGTSTSVAADGQRGLLSSSTPPFKFGTVESRDPPTSRWSVMKDDFMLGKRKLKDWDKDEEMGDAAEMNNRIAGGVGSDDDDSD